MLTSTGKLVTGSQDGKLKFWDNGKVVKQVTAHEEIVRKIVKISDDFFITCSNDQLIKTWDMQGNILSTIPAHNSLIYALAFKNETIYSGGEDSLLKVWQKDAMIAQIEHPQTVYDIAVNKYNDILTACEDKALRMFSFDKKRANQSEKEKLVEEVKLKHSGVIGLENLPEVASMAKYKGKKDQEVRLFKNKGAAEAYIWSEQGENWTLIGEAMGQVKQKAQYEGDRIFPAGAYDYIFDIDIGSGVTKKLPYNNGENPIEIGDKFCAREDLGRFYTEQIADFIRRNADNTSATFNKPDTAIQEEPIKLQPSSEYILFKDPSLEKAFNKITELNTALIAKPSPLALSARNLIGLEYLQKKLLDTKNWNIQRFEDIEFEVFHKLLDWPTEMIIAPMDLIRVFVIHPFGQDLFSVLEKGRKLVVEVIKHLNTATPNCAIMCLRALCNMFDGNMSSTAIRDHLTTLLSSISKFAKSDHKGVQNAYTSILYKY